MKISSLGKGPLAIACMGWASVAYAYDNLFETGFYELNEVKPARSDLPKSGVQGAGKANSRRHLFAAYSPQYPLWSDGSQKRRWIYIPGKKKINTRYPDSWVFPKGTKIWKEFSFDEAEGNRKIETRYMEKRKDGSWVMQSFVWNDNQTLATAAPEEGIQGHYEIDEGVYYDIPPAFACLLCHDKAGLDVGPKKTPVLGFSALQLSDNRDPDAIHGEALEPGMITLEGLQSLNRVTRKMPEMPQIPDSEAYPLQRSVLGYLHTNCGSCHNETGLAEISTFSDFHHPAHAQHIQQNGTFKTSMGRPISNWLMPDGSPELIIKPGDSENSALLFRMNATHELHTFNIPLWHHSGGYSRTDLVKMPFIGNNLKDTFAIEKISEYIDSLPQEN
ncbi:hypothetical protein [Marinagarivorans cellulosilyticus]|uniref:Cytochrome c domain-containing protein n=1 Tax=Marinagarivorans cellulosilyticus TaxID=2721545 RepID=A0AAN1WG79_9GAMM|nr:hypothetical protein [Marinagarivorans cellulosilyticus]BCD97028.1 hypothetical protein MARGE09_P1228 [Marinagarivorans cellulosilyticus]